MESKCHKNFRQKFISFLISIYIYAYRNFSTTLDKGLRKNIKKKRRDGEIGEYKVNEMEAMNIKYKKWKKPDKSKRSSYNSVVFKSGCLLETYLNFGERKQYLGICILQKIPGYF